MTSHNDNDKAGQTFYIIYTPNLSCWHRELWSDIKIAASHPPEFRNLFHVNTMPTRELCVLILDSCNRLALGRGWFSSGWPACFSAYLEVICCGWIAIIWCHRQLEYICDYILACFCCCKWVLDVVSLRSCCTFCYFKIRCRLLSEYEYLLREWKRG